MPDLLDPKHTAALAAVIAAVIGGLASLVGVLITQKKARQTQEAITRLQREQAVALEELRGQHNAALETIKAKLGEEKDEKAARRDYEYDARKRLYEQCDPLLFQFVELSENALGRITNLAQASKGGYLRPDGSGWLDHEGYYFLTTLYRLTVPCAIFPLLQRRLTLLDLRLDSRIGTQFALCRLLYQTFRQDWDLSKAAPRLSYNPDDPQAHTLRNEQPAIYRRQGIYGGQLEITVEALIVSEKDQPARFLRYREFESEYKNEVSEVHRACAPVDHLFARFHPATSPVLWRILVAQSYIYRAVQLSGDLTANLGAREALLAASEDPAASLDWVPAAGAKPAGADETSVQAVLGYLNAAAERLGVATT